MIMGHVYFGQWFHKYIHAFHMPLWFILSGFFINTDKGFKEFFISKLKVLLIPYLFFGLLFEFIGLFNNKDRWEAFLWPNDLLIPYGGALWFLPAIFFSYIISYLFISFSKNRIPVLLLLFFVSGVIGTGLSYKLPLSFDSGIIGVSFMLLGYLLKIKGVPTLKGLNLSIAFFISILLIFYNGEINMRLNHYSFVPLFYLNALFTTVIYWNLATLITSLRLSILSFSFEVGKYSLLYVCLNEIIIVFMRYINVLSWGGKFISKIIETIIIFMICYYMNRILLNSKYKILIGK